MSFSAPIEFVKHGWSASQGLIIRTVGDVDWVFAGYSGVIEDGQISDGGSVPRCVWSLGISPIEGDWFDGAVLHDSIYRNNVTKFTRKQADLILLAAMKWLGVGFIKRQVIYRVLQVAGWKAWNQNQKQ
jgi:hypothetical protein